MAPLDNDPHATHTVFNQAPPLEDYNVAASDRALMEALRREGAGWAEERVVAFGALAGRAGTIAWGFQANENRPVLHTHDRTGRRIDEVEFHPSWHALLALGVEHGLHALPWREARPGAHVARAALFLSLAQAEAGVGCPLSMTYSAVPALRLQPELAAVWEPRITAFSYDPRLIPAEEKTGALCGMAMTEKQGGSDVRANTTVARPVSGHYEITGHKWFCSAPMCDAFLILAQAPGGLSCFLLPRFTPDGERNRFHIQRLKDKLGNRSNASSEIELRAAFASLVGEEGRGVPTILEMVMHTRLDCGIGAAASIRQGTVQAFHHARHRGAFGKLLIDQPLMRNVLADLAVESEAATAGVMRLARAFDQAAAGDEGAALFKRLATAVLKYWTCKRAPVHAAEALECLGGNGYVEEWPLARLYREAPLNSIWEGSGNVQCLDVLRALQKTPASLAALTDEIGAARGGDARLDAWSAALRDDLGRLRDPVRDPVETEGQARRFVERLALALQGSLLVRHAPAAMADAFCAGRLGGEGGRAFGTLPSGIDLTAVLERAGL
jgi:putative acyl-CoA dehydrogenase